jgi:hypothetical protein
VNWNPQAEASINLDLVLLGVIPQQNYNCTVTNAWFQSISTVVTNGFYSASKIPPNGNAALNFTCKKPFAAVLLGEEKKEDSFLF